MKSFSQAVWVAVIVLASGSLVSACPLCDSETGRQVQSGIFNDQFWANVLVTASPFPILLAIVALIYFDVSLPWKKTQARGEALHPSPTTALMTSIGE